MGLATTAPLSAATRTYIVTDYDSVRVEGPLQVSIQTGRGASARGEGDREVLDALELRVSSRVLTVRFRPSAVEANRRSNLGDVRLALTVPELRRVHFTGTGSLRADGLIKSEAELSVTGSGQVKITGIASDGLKVSQSGAGSISLSGRARKAEVRTSGSGLIDAADLRVGDLEVSVSGTATVDAFAERTAKVVVTGVGRVGVRGRPACTVRQAGGATVICGE